MLRRLALAGLAAALLGPFLGEGAEAQTSFTEGYRLVDTWTSRDPAGTVARFRRPAGVDVSPDDAVYAVDQDARAVVRLDASGRVTGGWSPESTLGALRDVAASADRVYVVGTNRVEVRTRDGALVASVSMPGASGVAVASNGRAFVARRTGTDLQSATLIDILDADGNTIETWRSTPFVIVSPRGLDVAADGRVYLAADGAVYVFANGGVVGGLRVPDRVDSGEVLDVAADARGRLFGIQGGTSRRVIVWDLSTGDAIGDYSQPGGTAVAVGPGDGLLVSTTIVGGFTGLTYLPNRSDLGAPARQWGSGDRSLGQLQSPRRVAVAAAGDVYLVDRTESVQRWSVSGDPLEKWPPPDDGHTVDVMGGGGGPCIVTNRSVHCLTAGSGTPWSATPAAEGWFSAGDGTPSRLAAVDLAEQRAWLYARDGTLQGGWDLAEPGGFIVAPDIALDGARAYLIDRGADRVLQTDLGGAPAGFDALELPGGAARVAARDGALYVLTRDGWVWKVRPDGTMVTAWQPAPDGSPSDIAVGPGGRVYVADPPTDRVLVFAPDAAPPPVPPPPDAERCAVRVDKRATPTEVMVGDPVRVTLSVRGSCPEGDGRIDIVLIVDQSGSMAGSPLASAQAAAVSFLGQLSPGRAQVAVVGFSTTATVLQGLTDDLRRVVRAIGRMAPGGQTVYTDALESALAELTGPRSRPEVPQVVIMLTDGKPTDRTQVLRAADDLKDLGVVLYTIGLGSNVDADLLALMAGDPGQFFQAPTEADLADVYQSIARLITAGQLLASGQVTDTLPPDMTFVPGSASPAASVSGRVLSWQMQDVPTTGTLLSYEVRPQQPGLRPTNESASLAYVDGTGQEGEIAFPVPEVNVLPRDSWTAYLPQVWKNRCKPQRADVVLLFDTSSSMLGPVSPTNPQTKLDAALQAGRLFLNAMQFPEDQAAIVTFDSGARRVQPLTSSRGALELSLADVASGTGTRLDLGLEIALVELLGSRHRERNNAVIVALTDGQTNPGTESHALSVALDARVGGIAVFTIALGSDADADLLWIIAGDDSRAYDAPSAEDLRAIYGQIAGRVLCE